MTKNTYKSRAGAYYTSYNVYYGAADLEYITITPRLFRPAASHTIIDFGSIHTKLKRALIPLLRRCVLHFQLNYKALQKPGPSVKPGRFLTTFHNQRQTIFYGVCRRYQAIFQGISPIDSRKLGPFQPLLNQKIEQCLTWGRQPFLVDVNSIYDLFTKYFTPFFYKINIELRSYIEARSPFTKPGAKIRQPARRLGSFLLLAAGVKAGKNE